jgi:hypothetical protein
VLGSRERARENHLASPWSQLKRNVKFAFRERFGRDKTVFQTAWLYGYDVGRELAIAATVGSISCDRRRSRGVGRFPRRPMMR